MKTKATCISSSRSEMTVINFSKSEADFEGFTPEKKVREMEETNNKHLEQCTEYIFM